MTLPERSMSVRARLLVTAAAVAAALAGTAIAPAPWDAGPADLVVSYRGRQVLTAPVDLGGADPVLIEESTDDGEVTVEAPNGFPVTDRIVLRIAVDGVPVSLGDVASDLVLADGTIEEVPVLRVDEGVATAARRPPAESGVVLAMLGVAVVLWVSEIVPLYVTSLTIPVVLAVAGAGSARETLAPFFDPIIVLFFAGFLLAESMHRVKLDHTAAVWLVSSARGGPVRLFATMLAVAAFFSMWMSNTAAVAVMIPIALAVTEPLGDLGYRKAVVLGIAYAATIGGVGSAVGTPANPLAISFIRSLTGREITFAEWFGFGLPMVIVFLPVMAVYLWLSSGARPDRTRMREAAETALDERRRIGGPGRDQLIVLGVFGGVFAGWLSQSWHGQSPGIVALIGVIALVVLGKIEAPDLGRISWPTLLTFGGGLTLGVFMDPSGTSDWIVTRIGVGAGLPDLVGMAAVALVALGLTTVASNTAAAATLIPLAVPLAGVMGFDPVVLVMIVAIASSVDFALVIGTPPTMLAYSTGLYSTREILRRGAPLDLAGIVILVLLVEPIWSVFGFV